MIKLFTESLLALTKTLTARADLSHEIFSSYQLSFTKNFTQSQRAEHALGTTGSTGGSPTARCLDILGAGSALSCRGIQSLPSTRASSCAARSMTPVLQTGDSHHTVPKATPVPGSPPLNRSRGQSKNLVAFSHMMPLDDSYTENKKTHLKRCNTPSFSSPLHAKHKEVIQSAHSIAAASCLGLQD